MSETKTIGIVDKFLLAKPWRSIRVYFLIAGLLILSVFVIALYTLHTIAKAKDDVIRNHAADLIQLQTLEFLIERKVSKNRAYLLTGEEILIEEAAQVQERYYKTLENLRERFGDSEGADLLKAIDDAEKVYDSSANKIIELRARGAPRAEISKYFLEEHAAKLSLVREALTNAMMYEDRRFLSSRESAESTAQKGTILLIVTGLLGLLFSGLLFYLLSRTIRLKEAADRELASERLKLQKSNEELEQFASVAAHDLRSPLQSMISWSQIVNELVPKPRAEELDQAVGFIEQSARRANTLVDDLLKMARVNTSAGLHKKVDLEKIVQETLLVLSSDIAKSGAHVELGKLPQVEGNPSHLESLFSNLIRNALTYRDKSRKPEITIGYKDLPDSYQFFVKDNGIGITPENADKIFQMFKRLHGYGSYPGTGIGLAFCKKVVELYGGRIWVSSVPGNGSTFYFTYPKTLATGP